MTNTTRRDFIRTSLAAATGATILSGCEAGAGVDRRPNLLFVFPDQMRGQALGFMGEDPVITPNLDRFAGEGVAFTQAVSNYPVCSPYRGMMLTGLYPHSNGVLANCNTNGAEHGYQLATEAHCWSDVLGENGYSLGYIGKWHLDSPYEPYVDTSNNSDDFAWNEWTPPERRHGFDFWYAYGTYDNHDHPEYWTTTATRSQRTRVDQWSPEHEADMAIEFIRNEGGEYRAPDQPWALVVSMNPPHMPYQRVPERYLEMYGDASSEDLMNRDNVNLAENTSGAQLARRHMKNYLAQVTGVDDQFGRILAELEAAGLEEDTIVVFTSDHGNCLGSHDQVSKNNHYEESMRVPVLIRWTGTIDPRQDNLLLSTPDIYPTLLELMGLGAAVPADAEGVSRASILQDGSGARPTSQLYIWIPYGEPALGRRGVRTHRHTLSVEKTGDGEVSYVLHDNVADPFQLRNIAAGNPDLVKELMETELTPWLEKTRDPWLGS
ncbi:MAG: sulfatase [Gemmatimonadetes bacterium]|nr:sulfatase [Gemmatimonadota bacterium]